MEKKFIIFLLALFCVTSFCGAKMLRYATWNVRWESPKDIENGDSWEKRKGPIAKVIRNHDFDIVGLQEGSTYRMKQLLELLPDYEILQTDTMEYNPIFIKKNTFQVLEQGRFYLSKTPHKKSKSWDSQHNRHCNWAKLKFDNDTLFVFNVHFDYKGKDAQFESSKLMDKKIFAIAGNAPFIFAGDLNFTQDSDSYKQLGTLIKMNDSRKVADEISATNGSYNYFDPQRKSEWTFDHIFASPRIKVHSYKILDETYQDGDKKRYPSDHSPVTIFLELSLTPTPIPKASSNN